MRKLFVSLLGVFMLVFFAAGTVSVKANSTSNSKSDVQFVQDDMTQNSNGEEITFEDLPDAVQTALKDEKYSAWSISKISKEPQADGTTKYAVEFDAAGESKTVKFDESGSIVD